ncbi:NADH-quinone oxidoreductase subunit N [Brevifollis gellanilyticus]|uniref:NADH-quinone oxidoreductase subunit N n=1 Tax=Brevifollis gellanilyticus TaxID=748831 RepID=A0A512MCE4_9BACT|nr:NADH-quinone oxidoreductase subunit N [Brevifollis gellanilyticus]GEP44021.1 NADH-quinone oxidoreductase subunit N [Brevifollis gellanilyticus]
MSVFTIEAFLAILGLVLLMIEAFAPDISRRTLAALSIGGTALALVLFFTVASHETSSLPAFVQPWMKLDSLAIFYKGLSLVITLLVLWLMHECAPYLSKYTVDGRLSELFSLPLIVCAGMMWMAAATDLVTVFVALELVTVSFYVLVAFARKSNLALEAGVKYLILGALSTGILVFGIAWIYGATGSLSFEGISAALAKPETSKVPALLGAAFLLAGLGFKVAAAPFQSWVPDVYQGAPIPVTTFLSVGSKAAGFVVLTRTVEALIGEHSIIGPEVKALLLVLGALTVLLGSLPAIFQQSVKRLLGYSSISHAGYLILALACGDSIRTGMTSGGIVAFYLATYLPMTVLAFLVLAVLRVNGQGEDIRDFRGLGKRSPLLALALTLALASLAGLPLTAGFMGKLFVFFSLVDHAYWGALVCATIGAAAGFYYYFRAIVAIYSTEGSSNEPLKLNIASKVGATVLAVVIVVLGVYPKPLQHTLTKPVEVAAKASAH